MGYRRARPFIALPGRLVASAVHDDGIWRSASNPFPGGDGSDVILACGVGLADQPELSASGKIHGKRIVVGRSARQIREWNLVRRVVLVNSTSSPTLMVTES